MYPDLEYTPNTDKVFYYRKVKIVHPVQFRCESFACLVQGVLQTPNQTRFFTFMYIPILHA